MTMPSINPGGVPLSAVAGLGQRHRDGADTNSDADFAGLLSQLPAKAGTGGDAKPAQAQPFIAGAAITTMLAGVRNPPSDRPAAPAQGPQDSPEGTEGQVARAETREAIVAAGDAGADQDDLLLPVNSEVDTTASMDRVSSNDASTAPIVEANAKPEEIQALLSSVMRSAPAKTASTALQASDKAATAGASTPLQGGRPKPSGETAGMATSAASEDQGSEAQSSMDTPWLELAPVGLDHQADSTVVRGKEQNPASALVGDMKLSVLQTQTHHAPVLLGGPMTQIAEGIRAELTAAGDISLTWSPSDATTAKPGADAPVKVLLIQLQPADLGTVTVRMSLKEDALELHIEASLQETAQRLQQDQDSLSKVLRSAGYLIDAVAIRVTEPDRSMMLPSPGSSTLSQSSYQGTTGGSPSEGGTSQGRGQNEHAARGHPGQNQGANVSGQQRSSSGGLYI
ncbi:MAG: flagellar hook-length control protein FliK [Hyphomicrobiaceae bacterium]